MIDGLVQGQAGIMSYLDIFWMSGMLGLNVWRIALSLPRSPGSSARGHAPKETAPAH